MAVDREFPGRYRASAADRHEPTSVDVTESRRTVLACRLSPRNVVECDHSMSRSAALRINDTINDTSNDTSNEASTETFPFAYPKGTSARS